jgi:hypothetical protein
MKDCYLGIYWSKRKEHIDECAQKTFETFAYLSEIDNSFSVWYEASKPKKGQIITSIEPNLDSVKRLLLKGRNYNDLGELMEDLGYLIYLKSFKDASKAHILSITCGCFSERLTNSVVLSISKDPQYSYFIDRAELYPIYRKLVEVWSPERGVIKCQDQDVPLLSEFYN